MADTVLGIIACPYCQKPMSLLATELEEEWNPKPRYVQLLNPVGKHWVKLDRLKGGIVSHKKSPGPYKGIMTYEEMQAEEGK